MKLLLLKIARVPLLLAAMLVGFAEIARGPAGVGADVYRDGDVLAQSASLHAQSDLDVRDVRSVRDDAASIAITAAPMPPVPELTDSWSDRLRDLAAGEERLTVLARDDEERSRRGRILASAGSLTSARAALAP